MGVFNIQSVLMDFVYACRICAFSSGGVIECNFVTLSARDALLRLAGKFAIAAVRVRASDVQIACPMDTPTVEPSMLLNNQYVAVLNESETYRIMPKVPVLVAMSFVDIAAWRAMSGTG